MVLLCKHETRDGTNLSKRLEPIVSKKELRWLMSEPDQVRRTHISATTFIARFYIYDFSRSHL